MSHISATDERMHDDAWLCSQCNTHKSYSTLPSLRRHKRDVHGPLTSKFQCNVCNRNFKRMENLRRHIKEKHGLRREACEYCMREFTHRYIDSHKGKCKHRPRESAQESHNDNERCTIPTRISWQPPAMPERNSSPSAPKGSVNESIMVRFVRGFVDPESSRLCNSRGNRDLLGQETLEHEILEHEIPEQEIPDQETREQGRSEHDNIEQERPEPDVVAQEIAQQETLRYERHHLDIVPHSPRLDKERLQIVYDAVAKDDPEALKEMVEHWKFSSNLEALNSSFLRSSRHFGTNHKSNGILHGAAELNSMRIAEMFVTEGYNVDTRNAAKWTPLYCAVRSGHAEMADYLLRSGANAGTQCLSGSTPLHVLIGSGRLDEEKVLEIMEILLKHGSPVDQPDSRNHTALTLSARGAYKLVAQQLLTLGALVDGVTEEWGPTPLSEACAVRRSPDLVALLLKHGANVNLRRPLQEQEWPKTALAMACSLMFRKHDCRRGSQRYEIVSHLLSAGASVSIDVCNAVNYGWDLASRDIVELLRESGTGLLDRLP